MGLVSTGQDYSLIRFASALLDELGHQRGPAGLVAGADAGAIVAMEILVKQDVVAPVRVVLEAFGAAIDRPAAFGIAQEEAGEAAG